LNFPKAGKLFFTFFENIFERKKWRFSSRRRRERWINRSAGDANLAPKAH
jgi:hypothetical protein